jgi:hypothetical protein
MSVIEPVYVPAAVVHAMCYVRTLRNKAESRFLIEIMISTYAARSPLRGAAGTWYSMYIILP